MAKILIVGGGMAGASLALLLSRSSQSFCHEVVLVEAFAFPDADETELHTPSFDARSTALSRGTLEIYRQLGLYESILARSAQIEQVHVSRKGKLGVTRIKAEQEQLSELGAVIENRWLGKILLAALKETNTEVRAPDKVEQFTRVEDGYQVRFADGESRHFDLLVAADGAHSSTRNALGISAREDDSGQLAMIANVKAGMPHQGVAYERFLDSGTLALLPLPDQRQAMVWTGPSRFIESLMALPEPVFLQELQQAFGERLKPFETLGERAVYPLVFHQACAQAVPFAVVVGNAAHSLHPVAGQGFNLTLRDLLLLADRLGEAEQPGELALLQAWADDREGDQALIRQASRWLPELFRVRFAPVAHSRQLGLLALELLPGLRSGFARRSMGLENGV